MRFHFNLLAVSSVAEAVVGNQQMKMLCYLIAIDDLSHSHPNFFGSSKWTIRAVVKRDNFV